MIEFIERNDRQLIEPHVDDAVNTMFRLAAGTLSEADFVEWLRPRIVGTE
jgi:prophage maintenance system killer protein